jgi:catechol 2,3-dioxygenase-like lactoylglutathione lyase family enzyme
MIDGRIAVDHIGVSVPDLDEAISFFVDVFGFEVVLRAGPYDNFGYVWPGEDGPEQANLRLAVLRQGDHNVELLEYSGRSAGDLSPAPRPADPGGMHLALYVEDIYEAEARLKGRSDIRFLCPVEKEQGGPLDGLDWAYLLTSWGLVIELIRWQPGLPYEAATEKRLAPPPWLRSSMAH